MRNDIFVAYTKEIIGKMYKACHVSEVFSNYILQDLRKEMSTKFLKDGTLSNFYMLAIVSDMSDVLKSARNTLLYLDVSFLTSVRYVGMSTVGSVVSQYRWQCSG